MANNLLQRAKVQANNEFYTQYDDIQKEMNSYIEYNPDVFRDKTILLPCDDPDWSNFTKFFATNFQRFGIKKLISTSYANNKKGSVLRQLSIFDEENPKFDESKEDSHGKIFILDRDSDASGRIDINDLQYEYLEGDGDFRSAEVTKLRDEADIIITNPPFSLFKEFLKWIVDAEKEFIIIGNLNAITYKDVFPLFLAGKVWLGGTTFNSGATFFMGSKDLYDPSKMSNPKYAYLKNDILYWRVNGVRWFTNIDHGRRHHPISVMSMEDNLKYSKHADIIANGYPKYDNYNAIDVAHVDAIPSDYKGVMGVPISFLDKYCPDQFDLIGCTESEGKGFSNGLWDEESPVAQPLVNKQRVYKRLFIKFK